MIGSGVQWPVLDKAYSVQEFPFQILMAFFLLQHRHSKTNSMKVEPLRHTHTHPFNGPLSGTTRVSWYQKGKTDLDFTEARDSEWQWHQLGHM